MFDLCGKSSSHSQRDSQFLAKIDVVFDGFEDASVIVFFGGRSERKSRFMSKS